MIEDNHKDEICSRLSQKPRLEVYKANTRPLGKPFQRMNLQKNLIKYDKIPEYLHCNEILKDTHQPNQPSSLSPTQKLCKTSKINKKYYINLTRAFAKSNSNSMAAHYKSLQHLRQTIKTNFPE